MPLLDHFTPPVPIRKRWESFHSYWAVALGTYLNRHLPGRYFAAVQSHTGTRIESDVAEFEISSGVTANGSAGGTAVATISLPVATGTVPMAFPDDFEVPIFDTEGEGRLVAVIELVSVSNKDRPEQRRMFTGKCAAYLARGIGVLVLDPVHTRAFNFHEELLAWLDRPADGPSGGYAASYRPTATADVGELEYWVHGLEVGEDLPTVPFAVKGWGTLPLDLEETYQDACDASRIE